MLVYPTHTDIRMRKLKPNSARSTRIPTGLAGSLVISGMLLIARARPKMMSDNDSILDLAIPREFSLVVLSKMDHASLD